MRSISNVKRAQSRTLIASGATALPLPPTAFAFVPDAWAGDFGGATFPEFELELHGSTTIAVTGAVLYGATLIPLTFADSAMTSALASTDVVTKAGHGFKTGDGPVRVTGATRPGGLALEHDYWLIRVDANTYKFAESLALAVAGTAVDLTSNGVAMTVTTTPDTADRDGTSRLYWSTHDGLLGLAGDGAIALTADTMYRKRVPHSPRVVAYGLVATLDTGNVTAAIVPIVDR